MEILIISQQKRACDPAGISPHPIRYGTECLFLGNNCIEMLSDVPLLLSLFKKTNK